MNARTLRSILVVCVAAVVPACGDGPAPGPSLVNGVVLGDHYLVALTGSVSGGPHVDVSSTADLNMNGSGTATVTFTDNANGTISVNGPSLATYLAFSDGTLRINPPGVTLSGGIDSNQNLGVLAMTSASPPQMVATIRKNGTTLVTDDLVGDWWIIFFGTDPAGPSHRCEFGTLTISAGGGFTSSLTTNVQGTVTGPAAGTGSCSIASTDGVFSLTPTGGDTFSGGVMAGANIAVGGTTLPSPGADPQIFVMIRKAGAFTPADLAGTYFLATFGIDLATGFHGCETGTVTFDGAAPTGTFTLATTDNENGLISAGGGAGTVTVAADGMLTVTAGPETILGGMLLGGDILIAANMGNTNDPQIVVAIKR